jgi:hypothetical protein
VTSFLWKPRIKREVWRLICQRNCNTKMYIESVVWGSESLLTQVNGGEAKFVEVLRHKKEGSGFNKSLENFQGPHRVQFPVGSLEIFEWFIPSVRIQWPWSRLTLWEKAVPRNYLGSKVRHLHRAGNFAVLVVPNVKVRVVAQRFLYKAKNLLSSSVATGVRSPDVRTFAVWIRQSGKF